MCEIMQKYEDIAAQNAVQKERIEKIQIMLRKNYSKEDILDLGYTEEDYAEAEAEFCQSV